MPKLTWKRVDDLEFATHQQFHWEVGDFCTVYVRCAHCQKGHYKNVSPAMSVVVRDIFARELEDNHDCLGM